MAASFTHKKVKYTILSKSTVCVAESESHKKLEGDLVIPETIEKNAVTYRVVKMERWCFASSSISSVLLPKGLETIPSGAFYGCSLLSHVDIPASVKTIDGSAFENTPFLQNLLSKNGYVLLGGNLVVVNPELSGHFDVPAGTKSIAEKAFSKCSKITSITVPEGVVSIEDNAFDGCINLRQLVLPDSLTGIGGGAFRSCTGLTEIRIPEGVTQVGYGAFEKCKSLKSLVLPNSLKSIGKSAFAGCGIESIAIPEGITAIPESAFRGCSRLESVSLPQSLLYICPNAFERCYSLKVIEFPDKMKVIGAYAFKYCNGLHSISLPPSIELVDSGSFLGCTGLTKMDVPDGVKVSSSWFGGCSNIGKEIKVPESIDLTLVGNPYELEIFADVPASVAEGLSQDDYSDLGEYYYNSYRFIKAGNGDLSLDATGEGCAFSKDMVDPEANVYYYNDDFELDTLLLNQPQGSYIVIDRRIKRKASWGIHVKLEGSPFNPDLLMFHRRYSTDFIHKLTGCRPGDDVVYVPDEVFYCGKPVDAEFISDQGDKGGVHRFVFCDGRIVKELDFE